MKLLKVLVLVGSMAASMADAATGGVPGLPAQVSAAHDLLASMQAEKMVRMTAGMSRYENEKQRKAVFDKLGKVAPEEIYQRMAGPVAHLISPETVVEMTRFYRSSYGKRVLTQTYNSGPSLYPSDPVPSPSEKAELKRPAYIKAEKEFKKAEAAIHHQAFVLVSEINRR